MSGGSATGQSICESQNPFLFVPDGDVSRRKAKLDTTSGFDRVGTRRREGSLWDRDGSFLHEYALETFRSTPKLLFITESIVILRVSRI